MKHYIPFILFCAIMAGVVYMALTVWQECRESHSWLYCASTLSSK